MRKRRRGSLSIPLLNSGFLNGNGSSTVFRWNLQRFSLPAVGLIRCNRRDQRINLNPLRLPSSNRHLVRTNGPDHNSKIPPT